MASLVTEAQVIKNETVDGANTADRIGTILERLASMTGWAAYQGTQYTSGAPFSLAAGQTVVLPNDAGSKLEIQKPYDIDTFYDPLTQKILGRNGDGMNITIEFKVRPTSAASNVRIETVINIGGAVGDIYPLSYVLNKGNGVEHNYLSSFNVYTLDTWEANGGEFRVTAINSDVEIYNVRYVLTRTHKAY